MKKILVALCATAGVLAGVSAASADDKTSNLDVRAELINGCTFSFNGENGNVADFKSFANLKKGRDPIQKTFNVTCTNDVKDVSVKLDNGQSGAASSADRQLVAGNGTDKLKYQVYKGTPGQANGVWDDTAGGQYTIISGNSTDEIDSTYNFYVDLPAQETKGLVRGEYTDKLLATLTYSKQGA